MAVVLTLVTRAANCLETMLLRMLAAVYCLVFAFYWAACSEPSKPASQAPEQPPEAAEVKVSWMGRVLFEGIPMEGATLKEAIVVSEIDPDTRAKLEHQRALFEAKINPPAVTPVSLKNVGLLSKNDAAELGAKLLEMRKSYPQMLVEEKNIGNGRMSQFRSDSELFYGFAAKFKEMTLDNMTPIIESIDEAIQVAGKRIVESSEGRGGQARLQADTDLAWLGQLHEYLRTYLPLTKEVNMAMQRHAETQGASLADTDLPSWEGFAQRHSATLLSEVYSKGLDESEIGDDGRFTVSAEGELVIRVEYGLYSAYFLPESANESRVQVVDLEISRSLEHISER